MLVFRRQGESFLAGENVEIRILEITRNEVKIGVVAPREVSVYRSEISRLNRSAAVPDIRRPEVKSAAAVLRRALKNRES